MTTRNIPWPAGTPCWVDISVPDVSAATAFYGAVLGWSFVDTGERYGHYYIGQTDGRAAAAVKPLGQPGAAAVWMVHLASDDADATAKLIADTGGSLLVEPTEIPGGRGWRSRSTPPAGCSASGRPAGWSAPASSPRPARWPGPMPGSPTPRPVGSSTRRSSATRYRTIPDAPAGYATVHVGDGEPVAGSSSDPDGVPSHWLTYFSVADVDASVAVAARAGATVLLPADDTGSGRIAILVDPFGATFAVHRPPDGQ